MGVILIISVIVVICGIVYESKFLVIMGYFFIFSATGAELYQHKLDTENFKDITKMSTRASIRIFDGEDGINLYHHCDGDPDGIGVEIKEYLDTECPNNHWSWKDIANDFLKGRVAKDKYYVVASGSIYGDEDYVYTIDCGSRKLKCYRHSYDAGKEETEIPENEIIIR